MLTILAIPGSLRSGSWNAALARAAAAMAPPGWQIEVASIRGIPLYDADLEEQGIPQAVADLKERVVRADALLLVTPEYNHSLPGVLKNAIDWLSRPPSDVRRVFGDRVVGLIGATTGAGATALSQAAWLPVLATLRTRPWFGRQMAITHASQAFDEGGQLIDPQARRRLAAYLEGFTAFIESARHQPNVAPQAGAPLAAASPSATGPPKAS